MLPFDSARVAAITLPGIKSKHTLVRGMMPLVQEGAFTSYAFNQINEVVAVPPPALFISVSLIDNTGEREQWKCELSAFSSPQCPLDLDKTFPTSNWPPYLKQPSWRPATLMGDGLTYDMDCDHRPNSHVMWWPIEGMSPTDQPEVYLGSPGWDLSGLVDLIYGLYTEQQQMQLYIYFHCMLGADRTGALAAALRIKAGMLTDDAITATVNDCSAGSPNADYLRLIQAYGKQTCYICGRDSRTTKYCSRCPPVP